jgi:hypothetical protein
MLTVGRREDGRPLFDEHDSSLIVGNNIGTVVGPLDIDEYSLIAAPDCYWAMVHGGERGTLADVVGI